MSTRKHRLKSIEFKVCNKCGFDSGIWVDVERVRLRLTIDYQVMSDLISKFKDIKHSICPNCGWRDRSNRGLSPSEGSRGESSKTKANHRINRKRK